MRRRNPVFRLVALVLALTFSSITTGRSFSHACPTHEGVPAASAHSQHGGHGQTPAPETHGCNCIGACCTSVVAATQTVATAVVFQAPVDIVRVHAAVVTELPGSPSFQLPFSNGPPAFTAIA